MAEQDIDAQRVAQMRALLAQRGGEEELRRRFGDAAVDGPEAQAARRQIEASRERQRQERERIAREVEQQRAQQRDRAGHDAGGAGDQAQDRPVSVVGRPQPGQEQAQQRAAGLEKARASQRALARAGQQHQAAKAQSQSRDAVHAM